MDISTWGGLAWIKREQPTVFLSWLFFFLVLFSVLASSGCCSCWGKGGRLAYYFPGSLLLEGQAGGGRGVSLGHSCLLACLHTRAHAQKRWNIWVWGEGRDGGSDRGEIGKWECRLLFLLSWVSPLCVSYFILLHLSAPQAFLSFCVLDFGRRSQNTGSTSKHACSGSSGKAGELPGFRGTGWLPFLRYSQVLDGEGLFGMGSESEFGVWTCRLWIWREWATGHLTVHKPAIGVGMVVKGDGWKERNGSLVS